MVGTEGLTQAQLATVIGRGPNLKIGMKVILGRDIGHDRITVGHRGYVREIGAMDDESYQSSAGLHAGCYRWAYIVDFEGVVQPVCVLEGEIY